MPTTPLIELTNITQRFETQNSSMTALKNIELTIDTNEFVCILGPSGCGKSTLLNIIAGFLEPTEGEAFFNGEKIDGPDWHRGVVFQSPTLYPWLTVAENIQFGPRMKKMPKIEQERLTHQYLQQIQLEEHRDKYVFDLSGGMRQRVALARVLASQPDVILMDEPLGALDALTRLKMQSLIRNLWHQYHHTFVMITHDVDEALSLGTKIIVMSSQPGEIEAVFDVPYSKQLIENPDQSIYSSKDYLELKASVLEIINQSE